MSDQTKHPPDDVKRFNPPINGKLTINGGLFVRLSDAAAEQHLATNLFAERLLEGALRDYRIFKTDWRLPMETRKEK
jgi:hypothetical protein